MAAANTSGGIMKYYDFGLAPNPRRVNVFINEKGLEIETTDINLRSGEQFKEAFLKVNPLATVPCLELDDGSVLLETGVTRWSSEAIEASLARLRTAANALRETQARRAIQQAHTRQHDPELR